MQDQNRSKVSNLQTATSDSELMHTNMLITDRLI